MHRVKFSFHLGFVAICLLMGSYVASAATTRTPITLPIEVVGPDGTTTTVAFNLPAESSLRRPRLWMKIHGLRYQTEASLQVNGGGWQAINEDSVTLLGLASAYGGIGGGFHTLQMTIPVNSLTTGANVLTFRFNGTDGNVSGFRVLALNVLEESGHSLIPSGEFVEDDPNGWQPPSRRASDIAEGEKLWRNAALTVPTSTGNRPILARCADCHAHDGRDLKYFNYSNNSIQTRSIFHGLSAAQGIQIASYIRSLNTPSPGRPWNPPYQPGAGLDSKPASDWSAGAGIDAVLDTDAGMFPYLAPGGSTASWVADQYLNSRELPIALQLPDWNSWLPVIHPMDAFPSFSNSTFARYYPTLRSMLVANDAARYKNARFTFENWAEARGTFLQPIDGNARVDWDANNLRSEVYSVALWHMVKLWEINQEFGLEGMPHAIFGSKANPHAWYGGVPFFTSPTLNHIPAGPGLGNGSLVAQTYLSLIWYQMQLILNDGQGQEIDHSPIDFPYAVGRVKDLSLAARNTPEIMLTLERLVKTLQEETLSGIGPEKGQYGWHPTWVSPSVLVHQGFDSIWGGTPSSMRTSISETWTRIWFAQLQKYSAQQFYQGGWARAADDPAKLSFETSSGGQIWFSLPRLRYYGIDPSLTYQISSWAARIWPLGNWTLNNSATCSSGLTCMSGF